MNEYGRTSPWAWLLGGAAVIAAIVGVVCGFAFLASIKGTDSGQVCVVRQGGMFDGRDIAKVRQPGEGPSSIGMWNHQDCYPATERDLTLSSDPKESDSSNVDQIPVSTADAVQVYPEGKLLFRLTTDPALLRRFIRAYGRRKWDGEELNSEKGWRNFLRIRVRPVLTDALRQSIGGNQCISLNNLCQYITQADTAVKGEVKTIDTSQNLARAQEEISAEVRAGLKEDLGGDYFEGVRLQNLRVGFDPKVNDSITVAQTKRTEVATAKLEAERARVKAEGETAVKEETAKQIRLTAQAYEKNPFQARIDYIRALCGETGCTNLQVLGSSSGVIANLR